ncbi:MAG: sulfurtransferase TusA family protein [Mariprofundales bacterium]
MTSQPYPNCDYTVDASGKKCPLPVLLTKKTLAKMKHGQMVHIIATDPAAELDIAAFAYKFDHSIVMKKLDANVWHFFLQK